MCHLSLAKRDRKNRNKCDASKIFLSIAEIHVFSPVLSIFLHAYSVRLPFRKAVKTFVSYSCVPAPDVMCVEFEQMKRPCRAPHASPSIKSNKGNKVATVSST